MSWWMWMVLGAVLLAAELVAIDAQFYLVFVGLSAALVGLAALLGVNMPEWAQWLAFGALSLAFMLTFRKTLYEKIRGGAKGFRATLLGDSVKVETRVPPGGDTRLRHRGTAWSAVNVGSKEIVGGDQAKIVEVDGLTLHITAD